MSGIGLRGGTVTCRTSRSRCSPPAARRRPSTPSTPGTEARRGPLLAARHGCTLRLAILRAAGRILVPTPPPTHPWPRPGGGGMDESRALQRAGWAGAASVALLVIGAGIALLLWFAVGLRRVLDRLSGGDPLAHATVPAAALLGGLMITGVSLDVSSSITALSDEFTPDPDTARVLGTAGGIVALTGGLVGGAVLVAVTTRIAQQARALPTWAVWVSYAVA